MLAAEGVKIAIIDQTQEPLDKAVAEVRKIGEAIGVTADLTKQTKWKSPNKRFLTTMVKSICWSMLPVLPGHQTVFRAQR